MWKTLHFWVSVQIENVIKKNIFKGYLMERILSFCKSACDISRVCNWWNISCDFSWKEPIFFCSLSLSLSLLKDCVQLNQYKLKDEIGKVPSQIHHWLLPFHWLFQFLLPSTYCTSVKRRWSSRTHSNSLWYPSLPPVLIFQTLCKLPGHGRVGRWMRGWYK